jgi:hypothetical protein
VAAWRKASVELTESIPAGAWSLISDAPKVVLIPDDVLWRVPFEAFPVADGYLAESLIDIEELRLIDRNNDLSRGSSGRIGDASFIAIRRRRFPRQLAIVCRPPRPGGRCGPPASDAGAAFAKYLMILPPRSWHLGDGIGPSRSRRYGIVDPYRGTIQVERCESAVLVDPHDESGWQKRRLTRSVMAK